MRALIVPCLAVALMAPAGARAEPIARTFSFHTVSQGESLAVSQDGRTVLLDGLDVDHMSRAELLREIHRLAAALTAQQ